MLRSKRYRLEHKRRTRWMRKYYIFLALDYSQIEIRILAEAAKDEVLLAQFRAGFDIHCLVGEALTGIPAAKIKTDEKTRKFIKNFHFGMVYGLDGEGLHYYCLAKGIKDSTVKKCTKYRAIYFKKYFKVGQFIERTQAYGRKYNQVVNMFGFVRKLGKNWEETRTTDPENQMVNCVDLKTQILTKRGWLRYDQLRSSDLCLVRDEVRSWWEHPKAINKYPTYKGPVHHWEAHSFSAVTTPDHRWLTESMREKTWHTRTTKQFSFCSDSSIPRVVPALVQEANVTDDWLRLVGWALTDGYFAPRKRADPGIVQIMQKDGTAKARKIQALMDRFSITTGAVSKTNQQKCWSFSGDLGRSIRRLFPDRVLTAEFVATLSRRQARILIQTMQLGDGIDFCARDRQRVDAFQMLGVVAGYSSGVQKLDHRKYGGRQGPLNFIVPTKPHYTIKLHKRQRYQLRKDQETIKRGNGVWCPTFASDGAWVARREDKIFVTKNSPIQGAAHHLLLTVLALVNKKRKTYSELQCCLAEIHDALLFRVRLDRLPAAYTQAKQLMEHDVLTEIYRVYKRKLSVPLVAEAKAGFRYGTMTDYTGESVIQFLPKLKKYNAVVEKKIVETYQEKAA